MKLGSVILDPENSKIKRFLTEIIRNYFFKYKTSSNNFHFPFNLKFKFR